MFDYVYRLETNFNLKFDKFNKFNQIAPTFTVSSTKLFHFRINILTIKVKIRFILRKALRIFKATNHPYNKLLKLFKFKPA